MNAAEFDPNSSEQNGLTVEEAYDWAGDLLKGAVFFLEYNTTLADVQQIRAIIAQNDELKGVDLSDFDRILNHLHDDQLKGIAELNQRLETLGPIHIVTKDGDSLAVLSLNLEQNNTCTPVTTSGIVQLSDIEKVVIPGHDDE